MVSFRRFDTVIDLGGAAAELIAEGIVESGRSGNPYLLGCPGGRTPVPIYEALGRLCAENEIDCSHVVIVMMDDYLDPDETTPTPVASTAHNSCRRFAERQIRQVLNQNLPIGKTIPSDSVWLPDALHPERYDARIDDAGGVDLFIVASGASDGHVAFCGPGADLDGQTAIVELARSTRADNVVTFPDFASADEVPTHGVSVGLGTIRRHSRAVLMVLHGSDKSESVCRLEAAIGYDPSWPATFIHECSNARIWTDESAHRAKAS